MAKKKSALEFYKEIPLENLVEADWNYKKAEDKKSLEKMEKLKKNLLRNKQVENLIVRDTDKKGFFEVVNGNHRLKAMESIGMTTAVCFMMGKITQAHAERIAAETNETKFDADPLKLAALLARVSEEFDMDDMISTMPFSESEMDSYTKLLKFDWEQYDPGASEADSGGSGDSGGVPGAEGSGEITLESGSIKKVHVNQHNIRANKKNDNYELPVITIKTSDENYKCFGVEFKGESDLIYRPEKPLACGAKVWLETTAELVLRDASVMTPEEPDEG